MMDNNGIGEDDSDEEADNNSEGVQEHAEETSVPSKKPFHMKPLAPWLMDTFSSIVKASAAHNKGDLSSSYAEGRFWIEPKDNFFSLGDNDLSLQILFNPCFFLWNPLALCPDGIPCLRCQTRLHRKDYIRRPRRCVDFDDCFWIIGYHYRCPSCLHPKSGNCGTVTFHSWETQILDQLPSYLSCEFLAWISYCSAVSLRLFSFMHSCFQKGMGAKQFSDSLRVQHLLHYDQLHLQYLHYLAYQSKVMRPTQKYKAFCTFNNISSEGYHGFVPSSQYL